MWRTSSPGCLWFRSLHQPGFVLKHVELCRQRVTTIRLPQCGGAIRGVKAGPEGKWGGRLLRDKAYPLCSVQSHRPAHAPNSTHLHTYLKGVLLLSTGSSNESWGAEGSQEAEGRGEGQNAGKGHHAGMRKSCAQRMPQWAPPSQQIHTWGRAREAACRTGPLFEPWAVEASMPFT